MTGRLAGQAPEIDPQVYLTECGPDQAGPGQFLDVEIVGARGYDLVARPVGTRRLDRGRAAGLRPKRSVRAFARQPATGAGAARAQSAVARRPAPVTGHRCAKIKGPVLIWENQSGLKPTLFCFREREEP